jgi:hypothetical protein
MSGKSKLRGLLPLVSRKQYERDRRVPGKRERVAGLLILRRRAERPNDTAADTPAAKSPLLLPHCFPSKAKGSARLS